MDYQYKEGDIIELIEMKNDPNPIPVGMQGVITNIINLNYFNEVQIWVKWNNGRKLAVILPIDKIKKI